MHLPQSRDDRPPRASRRPRRHARPGARRRGRRRCRRLPPPRSVRSRRRGSARARAHGRGRRSSSTSSAGAASPTSISARARPRCTTSPAIPERRQALRELKLGVMGIFYALPDADARNPNWAALGFPGPASAPPSPAQAPKTIAVEQLERPGDDHGGRLHRRLGRRRQRDRGRAAGGRPPGRRARARGLPQRGRLPPARAGRGRRAVPARRPLLVGGRLDRAARGLDARRRHRDQLDGLPAAARRTSGPNGRRSASTASTAPSSTRTSTPSRGA